VAFNLHAIAAPFTAVVSGATVALWQRSVGYATDPAGKRVPAYAVGLDVDLRVQALSGDELALLDSLNIQGIRRAAYASGDMQGADRKDGKGGDLLTFGGAVWLVATVLETWDNSGWCKVALVKQTDMVA